MLSQMWAHDIDAQGCGDLYSESSVGNLIEICDNF